MRFIAATFLLAFLGELTAACYLLMHDHPCAGAWLIFSAMCTPFSKLCHTATTTKPEGTTT